MFLQYRSCSKSLTPSLRESRIHLRFAKVAYLRALRRAAEDSKYASSRIKIQFIEFLCERLDPEVADLRAHRLKAEGSKSASRILKLAIASFKILAQKYI